MKYEKFGIKAFHYRKSSKHKRKMIIKEENNKESVNNEKTIKRTLIFIYQ
jgi:hypothetical protein